jgi:hypothetical protein
MPYDDQPLWELTPTGNIVPAGTYGTGSQAASGGGGISTVTERGGTSNVNQSVQNTTNNTLNASSGGAPQVIGNGSITISTTDQGAIQFASDQTKLAFDLASGTIGFAGGVVNDALRFAGGAGGAIQDISKNAIQANQDTTLQALKFAAGVQQGVNTVTQQAFDRATTLTANAYADSARLAGGIAEGLSRQIDTLSAGLAKGNLDVLNFFGMETNKLLTAQDANTKTLQGATVSAIETIANKNQSENAQGLQTLQSTLTKLVLGVAAIVVVGIVLSKVR